jgi:hypothetical protein
MDYGASKNASVRRRAEDKFAKAKQRDMDVMGHQRQLQQAEAAKLIRLRALRLAKEAADRDASPRPKPRRSPPGPSPSGFASPRWPRKTPDTSEIL